MDYKIGDTVKRSAIALMRYRDDWNKQGRNPEKSRAKDRLDYETANRGTVTAIDAKGVTITWSDGSTSETMDYLISPI